MIKIAMSLIQDEMSRRRLNSRMLMQVHDELVFDMHRDEEEELTTLVEDGMKNAIPIKVPIEVEMGRGNNWLEAH